MKIELIHPPSPMVADERLEPPLGLLLIASYLRLWPDNEIVINDLSGTKEEEWNIGWADVYGITVYVTSLVDTQKIMRICRKKNPKAVIVVGGAHPSAMPESPEFADADFVVVGDGEFPMEYIIHKHADTKVIQGYPFKNFLFPSFDLVDINSYHRIVGTRSLPLITTRGCPFKCAFCGLQKVHELGGVRLATPTEVFNQVKALQISFGRSAINFQDDMFTFNKKRLYEMLDMIKLLNVKFRVNGRAGYDDEETYRRLAEAGCIAVAWGIESGSQTILDRMNKKVTVQDNYNVIKWAKKYGISTRALLLIGFPGETKETLEETKEFIQTAQPDQYLIFSMVPYPGTDVWNNPEKYGVTKIDRDFSQYYFHSKNEGLGGLTFDTKWLSREEFRELEIDFRGWMKKNVDFKGTLQDYEKKLYGK